MMRRKSLLAGLLAGIMGAWTGAGCDSKPATQPTGTTGGKTSKTDKTGGEERPIPPRPDPG
jgi:hypothetical protein